MSIHPELRGGNVPRIAVATAALLSMAIMPSKSQIHKKASTEPAKLQVETLDIAPSHNIRRIGDVLVGFYSFNPTLNYPTRHHLTTTTKPTSAELLRRIGGCESAGSPDAPIDYHAQNPKSSASGGYQILDSTWSSFDGYPRAIDAPPTVQHEKAQELYREDGTNPWLSSEDCWRLSA